jgi:outer membrane protein assembly factor BamD (BamD/ComL family)
MSKYENNPLAAAVEKKAHLKKNISELVEQTQDASSSFNIALSALKNNHPDTAIKKFMQVLEIDNSADMERQVRPNLGQAYLQLGETNTALAEFRRALKLNQPPEIKAFIYANLGYIYTQLNFYGFAIREYRQAIKENRKDTTSLLTLGMLYETSFRPQEATEVFEQVLKFDPDNSYAKESLQRIAQARAVVPREDVVRLIKLIPTLGLIIAMSYDATYDGWFPMVIYVYPESPLQGKVSAGQKILSVFLSGSEAVDEGDERELVELLECAPNTDLGFFAGENEIQVRSVPAIQRKMEQAERVQVYKNWLLTFDTRLAWLWSASGEVREHIGPLWGQELESLVRELKPLQHTYIFDFAYALMLEHLQAFSITETDPAKGEVKELEMQYQIHLGRFFGRTEFTQVHPFSDLIQQFVETQFQYMANLLASRLQS